MIAQQLTTVGSAQLTLTLVAVAVAISRYQKLDLEKDIGIAVVRSFIQLTAIGFMISLIFSLKNLTYVMLLLVGMVLFASWTSSRRGKGITQT
jgi:putative ABC transport system permease protein